jgi:hypothetical protein
MEVKQVGANLHEPVIVDGRNFSKEKVWNLYVGSYLVRMQVWLSAGLQNGNLDQSKT